MQKVAGFTSANTKHTHTLPPRLHILEKNALSLWINQAQIEQIFYSQQKRKKKQMREGKRKRGKKGGADNIIVILNSEIPIGIWQTVVFAWQQAN